MHNNLTSSVTLSSGIQPAGDSVPRTVVQNLHSSEEDNQSPFDLKIACLCQNVEINNNKHVYRQREPVAKTNCIGAEWAVRGHSVYWRFRSRDPLVQILHSAEEDNLSPSDSKIACLCQSVEINTNKHVCVYLGRSHQGVYPMKYGYNHNLTCFVVDTEFLMDYAMAAL